MIKQALLGFYHDYNLATYRAIYYPIVHSYLTNLPIKTI